MQELNNSIYHEPGVGLLARVELDGVPRFYTQRGLESLIDTERRHLHDVSHLVDALDELVGTDRDYQNALDDCLRRFSSQIQNRDFSVGQTFGQLSDRLRPIGMTEWRDQ